MHSVTSYGRGELFSPNCLIPVPQSSERMGGFLTWNFRLVLGRWRVSWSARACQDDVAPSARKMDESECECAFRSASAIPFLPSAGGIYAAGIGLCFFLKNRMGKLATSATRPRHAR